MKIYNSLLCTNQILNFDELIKKTLEKPISFNYSEKSLRLNDNDFFNRNASDIIEIFECMLKNRNYNGILEKLEKIIDTGSFTNDRKAFIKNINNGFKLVLHFSIGESAHILNEKLYEFDEIFVNNNKSAVEYVDLELLHLDGVIRWTLYLILNKFHDVAAYIVTGPWAD